jgi:hypothetical protein
MRNWCAISIVFAVSVATLEAQDSSSQGRPEPSFAISVVKSDRVWKLGVHKESYDDVAAHIVKRLIEGLEAKSLRPQPLPEMTQRRVVIEVLEVSASNSVYPKPNTGVAATLQITDSGGKQILYSKGYHGEAKSLWKPPSSAMIRNAADALVISILEDEQFIHAIVGASQH